MRMVKSNETGYARPQRRSVLREDNPALMHPRSVRTFSKMAREDAQARSVLKAVCLPIERTTWRVTPNGADPDVVRMVSEDLNLLTIGESGDNPVAVSTGRVSWQEHLPWALKMLTYGHAFFEKVYTDGSDGPQRLRKLAPRLQDTIRSINVAHDGGLESITQKSVTDKNGRFYPEVELEVGRLLAYVNEPEDMSWVGTSLLRPAYKHWVKKDDLLELEAIVLERNGMGVPVYESYSEHDQQDIDDGQELVEGLRAGAAAGASIKKGSRLTIQGVSGQLVSPREAITYHDSQIARSALAHALNLEGKGGSYALAEVQMDLFIQYLQAIAERIATIANKYLVEDMVEKYTGERVGPFPLITFDPVGSKKELTAEALAALVRDGVILPDKDLEEEIRRRYNLPPKRPLEEALAEKNSERGNNEETNPGS
ncbi:portal protein [Corynebacterium phage CL31]|nr:portal protein [Corynebacterium phage CL31]